MTILPYGLYIRLGANMRIMLTVAASPSRPQRWTSVILATCASSVLLLPGCVKLPFATGGSKAPSGAAKPTAGSTPTSEPQSQAQKYAALSDADAAALGVKLVTGQLHQVTGYTTEVNTNSTLASGTFAYASEDAAKALDKRLLALAAKNRKVDVWELQTNLLAAEFCENQFTLHVMKGRTPAQKAAECKEHGEAHFRISALRSDRGLAPLLLEAWLPSLPNDAARIEARAQLVKTLGGTVKDFHIPDGGIYSSTWGYVIEPKEPSTWDRPALVFAAAYADSTKIADAVSQPIKQALVKAPKQRCFWQLLIVTKVPGGPMRYEPQGSVTGQAEFGDVECSTLKSVRSDAALLKVVKVEHPTSVAATQFDKNWTIEKNAVGVETRRSLAVKTYQIETFE